MQVPSTSLSKSNPLSDLAFDELLALADAAWAHSNAFLPGNDEGKTDQYPSILTSKSYCLDDKLTNPTNKLLSHHHLSSLEQHSIIHEHDNPQGTSCTTSCSITTSQAAPPIPDNGIRAERRPAEAMQMKTEQKDQGKKMINASAIRIDNNGTSHDKEAQHKRTQKPVSPKPAQSNNDQTEKRMYAGRKISLTIVTVESTKNMMPESANSCCNRSLNFDKGVSDESSADKENATMHPSREIGVVAPEMNAGNACELNGSMKQVSNYTSFPNDKQAPGTSSKSNLPVEKPKVIPAAKRKCVRKKGLNKNSTPPTEITEEFTEELPEYAKMSCRRSLSPDIGARDESSAGRKNGVMVKETNLGLAYVVGETPVSLAYNQDTWMEQALNSYRSLPEDTQSPSTYPSTSNLPGAKPKESPTSKRKYVRKKKLNSTATPTEMTGELTEPNMSDSSTIISCGRPLNFDKGRRDESNTCRESLACDQNTLAPQSNPPRAKLNANPVENKTKRKGLATARDGNNNNSQNIQKKRRTEMRKTSKTHITSSVTFKKEVPLTCTQEVAQAHPYASNSNCWMYGGSEYNAAIHNAQTFEEFILTLRRLTGSSQPPALTYDCNSLTRIRNSDVEANYNAKQLGISDSQTFGDADRPQTCIDFLAKEMHVSFAKKKRSRRRRPLSSSAHSTANETQQHHNFAWGNHHLPLGKSSDIAHQVIWKSMPNVEALAEQFRQLNIDTEASGDLTAEMMPESAKTCCRRSLKIDKGAREESSADRENAGDPHGTSDYACCSKRTSQNTTLTPDNAIKMQINLEEKDRGGEEKDVSGKKLDDDGTPPNKVLCDTVIEFAAVTSPFKENHSPDEESIHYIDLNKTPQQKPKRRKIRPKVIREGKPKRSRKPVTPKPVQSKENPTGKRKYVRKKGLNKTCTPSTEVTGELTEEMPESAKMCCRRSLNFDIGARDDSSAGRESTTALLGKENGVVIQETNSGLACDLNASVKHASNSFMSLPEDTQAPDTSSQRTRPGAKPKENPDGKRRYARRKEMKTSVPPTEVTGELTTEKRPEFDKGAIEECSVVRENATIHLSKETIVSHEMNPDLAYDVNTSMKQASQCYMSLTEDTQATNTSSRRNPHGAKPKESPTAKRKYVKRSGLNKSPTPTEVSGDLTAEMMPESAKTCCRRSLNFDKGAREESSADRENATVYPRREIGLVMQEMDVGLAHDMNTSTGQAEANNFTSFPNEQTPSTSSSKNNPPGAKLNANSVENKTKRKGLVTAQDGNISNSQVSTIGLQKVGYKRKDSGTIKCADNSCMNLIGARNHG